MTFPTKQATATTQQFTATTSPTYNLPSGITSGDLLLLFVNTRGASTVTLSLSGWTQLFTPVQASSTNTAYGFYRFANGTEGSTIGGTFSSSVGSSSIGYRFSGASAVFAGTPATANSANPNPPSVAPGAGSLDFYWLALGFVGERNVTGNPTNYANLLDSGRVSNQSGVFGTDRQLNASSEDPATYTLSAGANWVAQTVAIKPVTTISGNLAATESNDTAAASGDVLISGALSRAETTDALLANGGVLVQGTLEVAETADSFDGSASIVASGALDITEAPDVFAAMGALTETSQGSLAATEFPDTFFAASPPLTASTERGGLGGDSRLWKEVFRRQPRKREKHEQPEKPRKRRTTPNGRLLAALSGDPEMANMQSPEVKGLTELLTEPLPPIRKGPVQMTPEEEEEAIALLLLA